MRKVLNILLLIIPIFCYAQKQGNIWYFGIQAGLTFSSGVPVSLSNGQTGIDISLGNNQEGTSCIADSAGNILAYTGGKTIWNKNNTSMPNGTGIMGGTSSTQSSLIVPLPSSDSIFYVFTSDEFQSYPSSKGYRYSIVNMCLDNGRGDVIAGQKNILLSDSSTEKLSACEDASGTGYWIMGHKMFSDEFYAWHLTPAGITNTVISKIGTIHGWDNVNLYWNSGCAQGQMKFSSAGTKLALVIGNNDPEILDLFDFNSITGVVSSFCHIVIDSILQKRAYGIEFSPDGSKMYVGADGGSGGHRLYQFNLLAGGGNCDSIIASRYKLFQSSGNGGIVGMQLGPDGKIYMVCNSSGYNLGRINIPNLTGFAANFDSSAVITGNNGAFTLPSFIAGYKYHNGISPCADPNNIEEKAQSMEITLFPNPSAGKFTIQPQNVQITGVVIYNVLGERVYSSVQVNSIIDLSSQSNGVYLVHFKYKEGTAVKKIIVSQ